MSEHFWGQYCVPNGILSLLLPREELDTDNWERVLPIPKMSWAVLIFPYPVVREFWPRNSPPASLPLCVFVQILHRASLSPSSSAFRTYGGGSRPGVAGDCDHLPYCPGCHLETGRYFQKELNIFETSENRSNLRSVLGTEEFRNYTMHEHGWISLCCHFAAAAELWYIRMSVIYQFSVLVIYRNPGMKFVGESLSQSAPMDMNIFMWTRCSCLMTRGGSFQEMD